jgi:hypothetical protein
MHMHGQILTSWAFQSAPVSHASLSGLSRSAPCPCHNLDTKEPVMLVLLQWGNLETKRRVEWHHWQDEQGPEKLGQTSRPDTSRNSATVHFLEMHVLRTTRTALSSSDGLFFLWHAKMHALRTTRTALSSSCSAICIHLP